MNWRETTAQLVWELRSARMGRCCEGEGCTIRHAEELMATIDDIIERYAKLLKGRKQR